MAAFLSVTIVGEEVRLVYGNGKELTVKPSEYPPAIQNRLMLLGALNKLRDTAANHSAGMDYAAATAASAAVHTAMLNGDFGVRGNNAGTSDLVAVIAGLQKCSLMEAEKAVAALNDAQEAELRKIPAVKAALLDIKNERAKARLGSPAVTAGPNILDAMFAKPKAEPKK